MLLIGFAEDEVPVLQELAGAETPVLRVAGRALHGPPELALLASRISPSLVPFAERSGARAADAGAPGRCVLVSGAAAGAAADLKAALLAAGLQPAVFGALRPAHRGTPLAEVAAGMLAAHESYWKLLRPVLAHDTAWDPASVRVAMNLTIDGGAVDDTRGGERFDAGHIVVLDGIVGEEERAALLDAITAPGWCACGCACAPCLLACTRLMRRAAWRNRDHASGAPPTKGALKDGASGPKASPPCLRPLAAHARTPARCVCGR